MAKPKRTDLTQERVRELFDYREDGELVWRKPTNWRILHGSLLGSRSSEGYIVAKIDRVHYKVHRLVFLYHHGYMPENEVDHIDRDRANNRIENLREVSKVCNSRNMEIRPDSYSGINGVIWSGKWWWVRIGLSGSSRYVCKSQDLTEAAAHRLAAEQCLGWEGCHSSTSAYLYMQKYLKERSDDTNRISASTSKITATHQSTEAISDRGH